MYEGRPRILVVEDDLLVAMDVTALVMRCECCAVGPVGSVGDALAAVRETGLEGAVLDVNLHDECVWPVAELLAELEIPIVLSTGYGAADVPERFRTCPRIPKPMTLAALATALREVGALRAC